MGKIIIAKAQVTLSTLFDGQTGAMGPAGQDANLLDWVKNWDTNKTEINGETLITPKIFAGYKTPLNTITGVAMGHMDLNLFDGSSYSLQTIDGLFGFKNGVRTFFVDTEGNTQLGNGSQYIKYNSTTGKVEFGSAVSLNWVGATFIDKNGIFTGTLSTITVNAVRIHATQINAGTIDVARINVDVLKASLITAANIEALTLNVIKGSIGGWRIDADSIFSGTKNNTIAGYTSNASSITIGSLGIRGLKWNLDATGAGALAGGNIRWDASGNVTFGSLVILNWTNAANSALSAAKSYTDTKATEAITTAATDATNKANAAKELAQAMAYGRMLYRDPTFYTGINSIRVYNNSGNGLVTITKTIDDKAPNDSKQALVIKNTGTSSPNCGGFSFQTMTSYRKVLITRIIAKIPIGRNISYHSNSIGTGGAQKWLTSTSGTGDWCEYICKVTCGTANFSSTNFFAITGILGTVAIPVEWSLSYATVFDVTSTERYTTTIDSNGIYTGTLIANQITSGTINSDIIAANSITSAKLDATSIKADIINTTYINGLSCTFIQGKIGGWSLGRDAMTIGSIGTVGAIPMQLRSTSSGAGLWYNGAYKPVGLSMLWYQNSNAGHIVFGQVAASGSTVKTGFIGIQMMAWDNTEYFCLSARYDLSGSKEVYNRIAGWAFDNTRIWKNNVSLSGDGSIVNGTVWKFNNDGSGQIANGNISWNAGGSVTFGASVILHWTTPINRITTALGGSTYTKLTQISSTGIYTGSLIATQITSGTISADRIAAGSIKASKLDAVSIKADIINSTYVNGLNCSFIQGKIGGWTIGADNITIGSVGTAGAMPMQIRSAASGSGYWYTGAYKPYGIAITWHQSNNAGHIVLGQVAASGNTVKKGFIGLQMMAWDNTEYFCLSTNYSLTGAKEVYNRIAGWAFDNTRIWKNNVSLGSDGSITNGTLWKFNNDGSGQLANGNISWNAAGTLSFSTTVSSKWTTSINNINTALGGTTFPKLTQISAAGIYTGKISAGQINVDTALVVGGSSYNGSVSVRDASNVVKVTLNRTGITAVGGTIGGWIISSTQIFKNSVILSADGSITNGTKWKLNNDGSGQVANGNVSWTAAGAVTITGTVNATSGKIGGFTISGNRLTNTAADSAILFSTLMGSSFLEINSATSTLLAIRADSARTGISIQTYATGARGISIIANAGSTYAIESYGPHKFGQRSGEIWNAPGVLFSALVKNSSTLYNQWGNGMTITSFSKTKTGVFVVNHNLGHLNYTVLATSYWDTSANYHSNAYVRVEYIGINSFQLRVVNCDNGGLVDTNFTFVVFGRNVI
ncbi:hypothetical protein [Dysgonomonas sp. GY617]|uniref:hypothetical protein n=1 Tax=Dysgonomonas sp. GY617 TaxID=2780420 RepID=UPI001883DA2A|nr:hypothetical protein [Dysgonomonas sp. GY617]MBF0575546.1 hypothetical protein [Dysgonomonas sp. GY617]